jgi:hypothetical protein
MNDDQTRSTGRAPATKPASQQKPTRKKHKPGEDIKHVLNTGLPPGINIEDAKDPGSHAPGGPVENRS